MSDLILHAYDASPFTQRALRLLAIKNLAWRWVETPMTPPKDDLLELTGGYRGTPVLQAGAHVYVDSRRIALELEHRYPSPSLFPAADRGCALALITWSDAFFRTGLKIVLALCAHSWPEAFRQDRQSIFPDIDFAAVTDELPHCRAHYRAHASLLQQQLADGRAFLSGAAPGLADAFTHPFVWFMQGVLPEVAAELLAGFPQVLAWQRRVAELGEGHRTRIAAATALDEAKAAAAQIHQALDAADAQGLEPGMRVSVACEDTQRGAVEGEVVASSADEVVIVREAQRAGRVVIHFPRLGYRVTPLG